MTTSEPTHINDWTARGRSTRSGTSRPPKRQARKRSRGASQPDASGKPAAQPLPELAWLALALGVGLGVRLYEILTAFPILTDEAIYLRWAEIIEHQGEWLISLLDGKQPLSYWLLAALRFVWEGDPLLQARLVSALAGTASVALIYLITKRLASGLAGLLAAWAWALFPWALIYDRLAYTEALVNFAGLATVWTALRAFDAPRLDGWKVGGAAAAFAAGCLIKTTLLLFVPTILAIAMRFGRPRGKALAGFAVVAATGIAAPAGMGLFTPAAPQAATHHAVLHHTSRFTGPLDLLRDPLQHAGDNLGLIVATFFHYFPFGLAILAIFAAIWLAWRRPAIVLLLTAAAVVPLLFQAFVLTEFETRLLYPHLWPWFVALAIASDALRGAFPRISSRWAAGLAAAGLILPFGVRSAAMLKNPQVALYQYDAEKHFGSYVHCGWGVREALAFLRAESETGGFILLTDAIWGVPADAAFAYLNRKNGVRAVEAWWLQQPGPIVPNGEVALFRSHYRRAPAGTLDLTNVRRIFYITDTAYTSPRAIWLRQPGARLVARFPKPGGDESVDVYRLR